MPGIEVSVLEQVNEPKFPKHSWFGIKCVVFVVQQPSLVDILDFDLCDEPVNKRIFTK